MTDEDEDEEYTNPDYKEMWDELTTIITGKLMFSHAHNLDENRDILSHIWDLERRHGIDPKPSDHIFDFPGEVMFQYLKKTIHLMVNESPIRARRVALDILKQTDKRVQERLDQDDMGYG